MSFFVVGAGLYIASIFLLFSDNALKINCLILFLCFRGTSVAEEVNNSKVQDILVYRRLSTLCSDVMKCRKFLSDKNIATLDVLRVCYIHTCVGGILLHRHVVV